MTIKGCFVELHPSDEYVDVFTWSLEPDGSLTIEGIWRHHYEDDVLMELEISELNVRNLFSNLESKIYSLVKISKYFGSPNLLFWMRASLV